MEGQASQNQEVPQIQETKTKILSLSIGDLIGVIFVGISIGTSVGFYIKNMGDIEDVKKSIDSTESDIRGITNSCASYNTSIEYIKEYIKELRSDIKELQHKSTQ